LFARALEDVVTVVGELAKEDGFTRIICEDSPSTLRWERVSARFGRSLPGIFGLHSIEQTPFKMLIGAV
jgi:biotin synthase-related radical SAM superfamily protein